MADNQFRGLPLAHGARDVYEIVNSLRDEIGRASCRERVYVLV